MRSFISFCAHLFFHFGKLLVESRRPTAREHIVWTPWRNQKIWERPTTSGRNRIIWGKTKRNINKCQINLFIHPINFWGDLLLGEFLLGRGMQGRLDPSCHKHPSAWPGPFQVIGHRIVDPYGQRLGLPQLPLGRLGATSWNHKGNPSPRGPRPGISSTELP